MTSRPRLRSSLVILVPALVVVNTAVFLAHRRTSESPPAAEGTGDIAIRLQRTRIDEIRNTVAGESLETLIEHLNVSIGYLYPGYESEVFAHQDDFETMLSNRRVIKLVALLSALPKDAARAKAKEVCDRLFEAQRSTIGIVLEVNRNPNAPRNTQSLIGNKLGFGAGAFALAHFAGPGEVIKQVMRLDILARATLAETQGDKALSDDFRSFLAHVVPLDNLFKINLIAYSAHNGSLDGKACQENVAKAVAGLRKKTVTLVPWDAETTSYDVTHVVFDQAVDRSSGAESLTVYDFDPSMVMDNQKQRRLIKQLAQICGVIK